MSPKEDLLAEAMKLPDADRLELAAQLYQSVEGPADPDAEQAWGAEIQRRIEMIDAGQAEFVPWEDVKRRLARGHGADDAR